MLDRSLQNFHRSSAISERQTDNYQSWFLSALDVLHGNLLMVRKSPWVEDIARIELLFDSF